VPLLRIFSHRLERLDSLADLLRRVAAALRGAGHGEPRFEVLFEDAGRTKVAPMKRLLERYPMLVVEPRSGAGCLTSLPLTPERRNDRPFLIRSLDVATAIEIAEEIPSRYPFDEAIFLVSPVPVLELVDVPHAATIHDRLRPRHGEIVVSSRWGKPRRELSLCSGVAVEAPGAEARRAPPLAPAVKALLEALGKPGKEEQELIRSAERRAEERTAAADLEPALAALDAALLATWHQLPFPVDLDDDDRAGEGPLDLRDALADTFAPAGWTYDPSLGTGRPGFYYLRRRTEADNELILELDRKPLAKTVTAELRLHGPTWSRAAPLWPRRSDRDVRILTPETARRFARNLLAATLHATATWATPIEALHGPGEPWLHRGRR
jgi:hypothetical protein